MQTEKHDDGAKTHLGNESEKRQSLDHSVHDDSLEQKEKEKKGSLKDYIRIFQYADTLDRCLFALGIAGAIISGAALPIMTLVFGQSTSTFNDYAQGQSASQFLARVDQLVLYFVYIFVGRFVVGYLATLAMCIAAARTTNAIRKEFMNSLLRKDVSHFDLPDNGSPATQVTTNGNRINQGIAEKLYTFFMGISLFFSGYIVALSVQWKLALIVMSIIPANVLIVGGIIAMVIPIEAKITRIYSRAATLAQDALSSIKTIHAFGAQHRIVKWYDVYLEQAHQIGKKKSVLFGTLFCTQTFLVLSGTALAFWEGFRLFESGEIQNVGTVFTVILSVTLGATSILLFMPQIEPITNAASSAAELFNIIDKPSLLDPLSSEGKQPKECSGHIEIRNLTFAYPSRPSAKVLQGLDLTLPAGKTTALVGPSGCGKSTLVGLLERWYQPTSGHIILDGNDIADYNTHWLRSNIRLVQQEPTLFTGTVYENIVKGLVGEHTKEEQHHLIEEACIAADAHTFIQKLPQGYHTSLGEGARMLSGGQRQRLSIARSVVSDPKILLFDEATSALDPRAERAVQDALNRVSENKTTLIIAHKLATVMAAHNIAVMKDGKVIEQGSHKELIAKDGLYAAMVRAQDLGHNDKESSYQDKDDTLERRQTEVESQEIEHLTAETVRYSLLRCIFIMLKEHPDLYGWYLVTLASALIGGGTYPAQAVLYSRLIEVFAFPSQSTTNFYSLMFFVLALANLFAYFLTGVSTNHVGQVLTHRYRREMIHRLINFDQEFFDHNSSGALTAKLSSAPAEVQELISSNIGVICNVLVNVISSSIVGIAFGWKLGLVMTAGLLLVVAAGYTRIRLDQKLEAATGERFGASAAVATEAVSSIRTVSLLTLERTVLAEYAAILDSILLRVIKNLIVTLIPYALSQSIDFLVMALGFWYGSQLIASGEYSVTQFFVIFLAVVFSGQGAAQFFSYTTSLTKAGSSANYILWLRTVKPAISVTDENREKGPSETTLEFNEVEFSYKQRAAKVLQGISMKIEPGTYAAFVGPSGCGKSTIISLLERFYDPTSGTINLGGDVSLMSPALYRKYMSLVQQEPPLYMGSVKDNITIGLEDATDEDVLEACRQANAWEFISSLPEGLETPCGTRGLQFSGGQRQRIALARALIGKPRLLLLDEATSALDTESERIVQKALDEAASTRTTIAVAHRLSTIRHADVIFVIEDGTIAEMGTHEELQNLKGRYHAMCLAQSLDQA